MIIGKIIHRNSAPKWNIKDDGYSSAVNCTMFFSYSSRDYNSRDYGPPPRDYSYREYTNSSSRDDYGSMSRGYRYLNKLIQMIWRLNHHIWSSNNNCLYHVAIAMVMAEAAKAEATWTVRVVAPTEIHTMVMVRYDSMNVITTVAQRKAAQIPSES